MIPKKCPAENKKKLEAVLHVNCEGFYFDGASENDEVPVTLNDTCSKCQYFKREMKDWFIESLSQKLKDSQTKSIFIK